jgi:hypothetical protein
MFGHLAKPFADPRQRPQRYGQAFFQFGLDLAGRTGAAPSVPIATVTGSRSTMAGVMKALSERLSTILTKAPSARPISAVRASSAASSSAA